MTSSFQRSYGRTVSPFACLKPNSESVLLGGIGDDGERWTRVITSRAARLLWYHIGSMLDPERFAQHIIGLGTVPIRSAGLPNITSDFHIDFTDSGGCEVLGRGSGSDWSALFEPESVRQLWTALDDLLTASE